MQIRGNGYTCVQPRATATRILNNSNVQLKANYISKPVQSRPDFEKTLAFLGKKIVETIEKPLTLIYMADTHKNLELMPNIKSAINIFKKTSEEPLVIHAGDYAMGSKGIDLQVKLLNKIGVDLATLGNHEFFGGTEKLAETLKNSEFQTVISNLEVPKTNPLSNLFDGGKLVKSTIKEINGKKYAFVGAVTGAINSSSYDKYMMGVKTLNPEEVLAAEVKNLEKQGIDRIILISHLGYNYDKDIAKKVPGIDVIVGGHSHIAMPGIKEDINLIRSNRNKEPVLLLHAGAYAEALGVTHLVFNDKGILQVESEKSKAKTIISKIVDRFVDSDRKKAKNIKNRLTSNTLVETSSYSKDKEVSKIVDDVRSKMKLVANISKPINHHWPKWEPDALATLAADATREITGAQIAMIHPGCIRKGINKGPLYKEYFKDDVIPFDTPLVKVELSGKDILKGLNKASSSVGTPFKPGMLHVSGLKYTIDMNRHKEMRVAPEKVQVLINNKYENIDMKKTYTVAYDKYLLNSGDNLGPLKNGKVIEEFPDLCYSEATVRYIEKLNNEKKPIAIKPQEIINVINIPKEKETSLVVKILQTLGLIKKSKLENFIHEG